VHLTLSAFSSALFSTWVFVEELGLLFDAGDGVSALLAQKSRKVSHVFVSHADRDHVAGLLQLHQLNAREGIPSIHYPAGCGSFPALRDFMARFDPDSGPATWNALRAGDCVAIDQSHHVRALASDHIAAEDGSTKSLAFVVQRTRRVLRSEHVGKAGGEIAALKKTLGDDAVTERRVDNILGYSGDAAALDPAMWAGVRILLHECTFLEAGISNRPHSHLRQVLEASAALRLEALVLLHFSCRYDAAAITAAVAREAQSLALPFPVFVVLPGQVSWNLLTAPPVWNGAP
jgi:ribonuclease Z